MYAANPPSRVSNVSKPISPRSFTRISWCQSSPPVQEKTISLYLITGLYQRLNTLAISMKSRDFKDAPPIRPPSMSACANSSGAFLGLQLPPYKRSEEHTSELQSLLRTSYDVFCLKNNKNSQLYNYNR